jgi:hypothetical protein
MTLKNLQKLMMGDKANHFVWSFFLCAIIFTVFSLTLTWLGDSTLLGASAFAAVVVAAAKEKYLDEIFDTMDLGFSIWGIVFFVVFEILQR